VEKQLVLHILSVCL